MLKLLLIVCFFACVPTAAAGNPCNKGTPLLSLLNHSDAVAVIERENRFRIGGFGSASGIRINAQFREFIKPSIVGGFDPAVMQTIYLEGAEARRVVGGKFFLVFLTYVEPNIWSAKHCAYLQILKGGMVRYACTAISDLFGDQPYERERLCLLNYPPSAHLDLVRKEIIKAAPLGGGFAETGKFARNGVWVSGVEYQPVVFELESRARKSFFASKRAVPAFPLKAYIKAETLSRNKFEKYVKQGVRFRFSGAWNQGSFVIESIDWMSGRRPRS